MAATATDETLDGLHNHLQVKDLALNNNETHENEFPRRTSSQTNILDLQGGSEAIPLGILSNPTGSLRDESWMMSEFPRPLDNEKRGAGVAFRSLNVYGFGTTTDYQKTFANYPLAYLSLLGTLFGRMRKSRIDILQNFEGLVSSGEMLLVLGKPGSGCTTFLKTLAGHTHGLYVDQSSVINYQGRTIRSPSFVRPHSLIGSKQGLHRTQCTGTFAVNAPISQNQIFTSHI